MQYLDDRIFNNYIMKYYKCNIVIFVILWMTQKTETQIQNFYNVKKIVHDICISFYKYQCLSLMTQFDMIFFYGI